MFRSSTADERANGLAGEKVELQSGLAANNPSCDLAAERGPT